MAELRIGTAEREDALAMLGEHFAQGRLSKDEYDERSDAVWTARTAGDLRSLFADLPDGSPVAGSPAAGPGAAPHRSGGSRAWTLWHRLPPAVRGVLAVVLAVVALTHLPLLLVAGLVWFVVSRRRGMGRPPWVRTCGTRAP